MLADTLGVSLNRLTVAPKRGGGGDWLRSAPGLLAIWLSRHVLVRRGLAVVGGPLVLAGPPTIPACSFLSVLLFYLFLLFYLLPPPSVLSSLSSLYFFFGFLPFIFFFPSSLSSSPVPVLVLDLVLT
jgi:hypothetical protein